MLLTAAVPLIHAQNQMTASFRLDLLPNLLMLSTVRVEAEYANLPIGELELALGPTQGGLYYPFNIRFYSAVDSLGTSLTVVHRPQSSPFEPDLWIVPTDGSTVRVDYNVTLSYYGRDPTIEGGVEGYLGYANSRYVVSWAGWVFLLPVNLQTASIHVAIESPSGWTAVTPWLQEQDGRYRDDNYYHFQRSTFGVGLFDVQSQIIDGTKVTIACDTALDGVDQISKYSFEAFDYVFRLFKTKILSNYLAVYTIIPQANQPLIGLMEASDSQAIGFAYSGFTWDLISEFTHRVFHSWNAFPPLGMYARSNHEGWFIEGTNEYYDEKALRDLGVYVNPQYQFLQNYFQFYIKQIVGTPNDVAITSVSPTASYPLWRLKYYKGALVSYLLDQLIQRLSGGSHSLADLLSEIYQKFHQSCCYSNADIETIASQLAGVNINRFFELYLYSNHHLPLNSSSSGAVQIDWPTFANNMSLQIPVYNETSQTAYASLTLTSALVSRIASANTSLVSLSTKEPTFSETMQNLYLFGFVTFVAIAMTAIIILLRKRRR